MKVITVISSRSFDIKVHESSRKVKGLSLTTVVAASPVDTVLVAAHTEAAGMDTAGLLPGRFLVPGQVVGILAGRAGTLAAAADLPSMLC